MKRLGMTAVVWLAISGAAMAQSESDFQVVLRNAQPVSERLMHVVVTGPVQGPNTTVELSGWVKLNTNIVLYVDIRAGEGDADGTFQRGWSLPVPDLPGGLLGTLLFRGRFEDGGDFQLLASRDIEVAPQHWPEELATAFIWPPEPTALEPVRYYLEPPTPCDTLSVLSTALNVASDGGVDFIDTVIVASPSFSAEPLTRCERAQLGPMQGIELGRLEPGRHRLDIDATVTGFKLTPVPPDQPVERREFRVRSALPGRLSGSWYNPDQSGHGLSLEVLDEGERLLAYWFTFDDMGNQAWIIGDGGVDETGTSATLDALIVEGGQFPPAFDPGAVDLISWGTIRFDFEDCDHATMSWETGEPDFSDGEMPVERLSTISGHGCTTPPPESLLDNTWRLTPYPVVEESAEPPKGIDG